MNSARTGVVLEDTRLPVTVWRHAFSGACSSKKGVSALQIAREFETAQGDHEGGGRLGGMFGVDETYVTAGRAITTVTGRVV